MLAYPPKKLRILDSSGFTVVELVIVLAMLGILIGLALPHYGTFSFDARRGMVLSLARSFVAGVNTVHAAWQLAGQPDSGDITTGTQILSVGESTGDVTSFGFPRTDNNVPTSSLGYPSPLWRRVMGSNSLPRPWRTRSGPNTTDNSPPATAYPLTGLSWTAQPGQQIFYMDRFSSCGFLYSHSNGSVVTNCLLL